MLWINLITDGPPALALGIDPKDHDVMMRQPRRHGSGILLTEDWIRLPCVGLVMMVGTLPVLDAYYPGGLFTLFATGTAPNAADEVHARTMAFTTLHDVPALRRLQLPLAPAQRVRGLFENKWLIVGDGVRAAAPTCS